MPAIWLSGELVMTLCGQLVSFLFLMPAPLLLLLLLHCCFLCWPPSNGAGLLLEACLGPKVMCLMLCQCIPSMSVHQVLYQQALNTSGHALPINVTLGTLNTHPFHCVAAEDLGK